LSYGYDTPTADSDVDLLVILDTRARPVDRYLRVSRLLRPRPFPLDLLAQTPYGATFHAQQCAEKYLKALLVSRRQAFPRTHDVVALHDLCRRHNLHIPVDPDQLERLSAYAVQVRYPGEEPTPDKARDAVQIAQAVR
jgi:hypothetical protein